MVNGNADAIFNEILEYAISIYIEEGDSKEDLLKKFNNDKLKLVQWLRERAFKKDEPIMNYKPAETKKEIPASLVPKQKRTNKKKPISPDDKSQNSIF